MSALPAVLIALLVGLVGALWIVSLRTVQQALYELAGTVRSLGRRIEEEAFVCGYTDTEGEREFQYATGNPHQALAWLMERRNDAVGEAERADDLPMPGHVEQEGDYDWMWFDTGVRQEGFWVERVGVLD